MRQITKFYISSFLKNQTYFTPIMILFLQFYHLSYQEVFWVFTIGSIFSFIIEIPTGIFADLYGKRKSIILSKILIMASFISFGFSTGFWMFVLSQLLYELGQAFRSGTETAYTYDYLAQNPDNPSYTEVKGKQKFYARVGESIASASGGVLAAAFGYNMVFFIAAFPAFLNVLNNMAWEKIRESTEKVNFHNSKQLVLNALSQFKSKPLFIVTANITLFTAILAALNKFVQPYMKNTGIPIEYFGFIYAVSLGITALAVRYSYLVEKILGARNTMNYLSIFAVVPAVILGFGYSSIFGVILFFVVVIVENIRSPIENSVFHGRVKSVDRATMGSILSLSKSLGKTAILPFAGYFADVYSIYTSILILAAMLAFTSIVFFIRKSKKKFTF